MFPPTPSDKSGVLVRRLIATVAGTTLAAATLAASILVASQEASAIGGVTLRQFAGDRAVGAAIAAHHYNNDASYRNLANTEFNSVTAENEMKWESLEPSENSYNWGPADQIVNNARTNNQRIRGHTLVWHSQYPRWLDSYSGTAVQTRVQEHIQTVMSRWRGQIYEWDVVNEPFEENGSYRNSIFYRAWGGNGYIAQAFRWADAVDPNARLCINDYNIEGINAKSDAMYNLVRQLLQQGVPIDCVGFQAHFIVGQVPSTLEQNLQRFAALGVSIHITELDVRIEGPVDNNELQQQARDFERVFRACWAIPNCTGVTQWGVSDQYSWVDGTFPPYTAPLMISSSYQAKPAYTAVINFLRGTSSGPTGGPTTGGPTTGGPTTGGPTTDAPQGACRVEYTVVNQWPDGFTASINIVNTGSSPINGWTLRFTFPNGQSVSHGWNANWSQSGSTVTAENAPWNGTLPPGVVVNIGFNGLWSGVNNEPTSFTLNNNSCTVV